LSCQISFVYKKQSSGNAKTKNSRISGKLTRGVYIYIRHATGGAAYHGVWGAVVFGWFCSILSVCSRVGCFPSLERLIYSSILSWNEELKIITSQELNIIKICLSISEKTFGYLLCIEVRKVLIIHI
jgi:hypothetical protein